MKVNEHLALSTENILLVPYSAHHVPTYHAWMQDPDLQTATASEPLTLPEEYDMQRSWRLDHDKLTFIICLPLDNPNHDGQSLSQSLTGLDNQPGSMIGDINLFLFPFEPEEADDDPTTDDGTSSQTDEVVGEIELMIARRDLHRKGYGRAALLTFLAYIFSTWPAIFSEYLQAAAMKATTDSMSTLLKGLRYLRVKIQESNVGSIALFENVGFVRLGEGANYFGEVELRLSLDEAYLKRFRQTTYTTLLYAENEDGNGSGDCGEL